MATNGRFLSSTSQALLYVVAIVVCLVALLAFALSFNALTQLAVASNIPPVIAWAWPVVVDASIIVATVSTLVLRGRSSRSVRFYPWLVLIIFGAVSILGNGYHALTGGVRANPDVAFAVGAVPAIALLASTHLLVVMLTSPHHEVTDDELAKQAVREEKARRAAEAPAAAVTAPSARVTAPRTTAAPKPRAGKSRAAVEKWVREQYATTGKWPSGPEVGDMLGLSRKSGARVVAQIREAVEAGN